MARIEIRKFGRKDNLKKLLLIFSESETESKMMDEVFGDKKLPLVVAGTVALSDEYGEYYISLEKLRFV